MDDPFKSLCVRLIQSMGHAVDADWFCEDDAWAFVGELVQVAREGKPVSAATQAILLDFGSTMGLKPGAPEGHFRAALEAQLGPSPVDEQTLVELVRFVRAQANGQFEQAKDPADRARLSGGEPAGPHQPYKNLDYGSD